MTKSLIKKLEKAVGPASSLDQAIYLALGAKAPGGDSQYWTSPDGRNMHYQCSIPRYTASIDAALMLVPPKWTWTCGFDAVRDGGRPRAELAEPIMTDFGSGVGVRSQVFNAATPAIAICIAALKAR